MTMDIWWPTDWQGQDRGIERLVWPNHDDDTIDVSWEPGTAGQFELRFNMVDNMRWWKGLEVKSGDTVIAVVETHDDDRLPPVITLGPEHNIPGLWLRLLKAKMFGIHTAMYDLIPIGNEAVGRRATIQWITDGSGEAPAR